VAFFALVFIQTVLGLSFKAAQDASGKYPFNPAALLILSEFVKMCMSASAFFVLASAAAPPGAGFPERVRLAVASFWREVASYPALVFECGGLAVLYCINNNLTFVIFSWADAANVNLIKAGSSFVSALLLWRFLGRVISPVQWSAIAIQTAGMVITQFGANCKAANTPLLAPFTYLALLVSLCITAATSVWNDHVMKATAKAGVGINTVSVAMYAGGALLNLAVHVLGGGSVGPTFFTGMGRPASLLVLLCNSLIGIAVTAVYKYADAVVKTFASACTTAVLFVVGALFFGVSTNVVVAAGCVCIFVATHLYSSNPAPQPPAAAGGGGGAAGEKGREAPPPPPQEGGGASAATCAAALRERVMMGVAAVVAGFCVYELLFAGAAEGAAGPAAAGAARALTACPLGQGAPLRLHEPLFGAL
jgi:drug/metabolite transporter (DMT)-like permease